jgi:hypothetical protein
VFPEAKGNGGIRIEESLRVLSKVKNLRDPKWNVLVECVSFYPSAEALTSCVGTELRPSSVGRTLQSQLRVEDEESQTNRLEILMGRCRKCIAAFVSPKFPQPCLVRSCKHRWHGCAKKYSQNPN